MNVRTIILLLILLLAAGGYYFFYYEKEGSTFSSGESNFNVEDTTSLNKITLTRVVQGEEKLQLILEKEGGNWQVNDRFEAFQPRVDQLLEVLTKMKIRESLNASTKATALKFFHALHTRLDIYQDGKKVKSILIGTQTKDAKGTLMMLAGTQSPYVLEIPGLPGYLNVYFPMDLNEWRENLLFVADRSLISSIEIKYDTLKGAKDVLLTEVNGQARSNVAIKKGKDLYLHRQFESKKGKVYGESFAGIGYPDMLRKLKSQTADVTFSLTYLDGSSRVIHLYTRSDNPNSYFAWIEGDEELITVQKFVIDPFLTP